MIFKMILNISSAGYATFFYSRKLVDLNCLESGLINQIIVREEQIQNVFICIKVLWMTNPVFLTLCGFLNKTVFYQTS